MSASLGERRGRGRSFRPKAEINITPMVDVMLVLLVIFMVTAPLLTAGVQVDLPKTHAAQIKGDDQPISVTIDAHGKIWIQETEVTLEELAPRLLAITAQKPETRIFVRGDKGIDYGRVMEVMGALGGAGIPKVALVTEMKGAEPGKPARAGGR
jgi:biopolymer transport protein TolR